MPTNLTDVDAFTDPIVGIADGDAVAAASDNPGLQGLANRTRFIMNKLFVKTTTVDIGRPPAYNPSNRFSYLVTGGGNGPDGWQQTDTASAGTLRWYLDPVVGARVTQVKAWIDGNGGGSNHAALPATKPSFAVRRKSASTGLITTVGSVVDAPADLAAYELAHSFSLVTAYDFVAGEYLLVDFLGETGANAVNNALLFFGLEITLAKSP